jgi:hypothetical protein
VAILNTAEMWMALGVSPNVIAHAREEAINSATSPVPFYFQQTLGGQDINRVMALPSYHDYRYRAPSLLLLQESFEHSIWGPSD